MHPYERLAEQCRRKIRDGDLKAGERLPTVADMAKAHGISSTTVRHALSWLRVEGFIVTTQRGSFVADAPLVGPSGHDRLDRVRRTGSQMASHESKRVLDAGLVVPPLYVAEIFDVDPGARLVRREYLIGTHGFGKTALVVDWFPEAFATLVPDLLSMAPGQRTDDHPGTGNDLIAQIEGATGRRIRFGRDGVHGRGATEREAQHLGVRVGSAITALVYEWSDDELITYSEWVLPERYTLGYQYQID